MSIERLKQVWVHPFADKADIQKQLWNNAAKKFNEHGIPDPKTNEFLKLVFEKARPDSSMTALDIGCGCGSYSIALAPHIKQAVGVDISSEMIKYAQGNAQKHTDKTSFRCLDWAQLDIDKAGYKKAFDIVFAHMTPAVADFATFDKMNECSKGWCFAAKPARKQSRLQERIFAAAGITFGDKTKDKTGATGDGIPYIFEYLWCKGYNPEFYYRSDTWHAEKSLKDTTEWMILWAKLHTDISARQEQAIAAALEKEAVNDIVADSTDTTIVTVCWHV